MRFQTMASLVTTASLLAAGAAGAQAGPPPRVACAADLQRLCPGVPPERGQLSECFRGRMRQVSPYCRSSLEAARQMRLERGQGPPPQQGQYPQPQGQYMQPPPGDAAPPQ
jgi:hypothetical protein